MPVNRYKYLTDGLFDRQKNNGFQDIFFLSSAILSLIERKHNLLQCSLSSPVAKSPHFPGESGHHKSKSPHFPHHNGSNLLQSPHKVPIFPHISPSPPPLGEANDRCIRIGVCENTLVAENPCWGRFTTETQREH